jgi:putative endonuclease
LYSQRKANENNKVSFVYHGKFTGEGEVEVMPKRHFRRKGNFWVYIVECADGTYYTGFTPHLNKRVVLHNEGKGAKYTRDRRPVKLVWSRKYKYFKKAFLEEKRIKGFTRTRKEKLVVGYRKKKIRLSIITCHRKHR